jgi:hypothetical protein
MKNVGVNTLLGNELEVKLINFIARYGNYTRRTPYVTIHAAYSRYIEMQDPKYLNACTENNQVIPVTLFLVVLYNACFMFQENNDNNLLIKALDTFDLGADVGADKFIPIFSECNFSEKFHSGKSRLKTSSSLITILDHFFQQMNYRGLFSTQQRL